MRQAFSSRGAMAKTTPTPYFNDDEVVPVHNSPIFVTITCLDYYTCNGPRLSDDHGWLNVMASAPVIDLTWQVEGKLYTWVSRKKDWGG